VKHRFERACAVLLSATVGNATIAALAAVDHSAHGEMPASETPQTSPNDMDEAHSPMPSDVDEIATHGVQLPGGFVRPITDADRAAAFPDLSDESMQAHMNDDAVHAYLLGDRVEWQNGQNDQLLWDATGWIGRDFGRLWLRSEGERPADGTEQARVEALWGKPVSRWWDLLAGMRTDFRPDPDHTWLALGVVGLAPYFFEVEATAYVAGDGDTAAQLELEYELLLTNRLVLQPHLELNFYGRDDEERGLGSGLSNVEAGLRLRYEIRRELAPYIGIEWGKKYGETEDFAEAEGEVVEDTRWVIGIRMWY
jgi:copper resistance protein B